MPSPTPVDIFAVLPFRFAELMAASTVNWEVMGVADASEAIERIPVIVQVEPPFNPSPDEPEILFVPRPRIIVCEPDVMDFGRSGFIQAAQIVCIFEMETPEEYRKSENSLEGAAPRDLIVNMLNWAGRVTREIMILGEAGQGYPLIVGGRKMGRVSRSMPEEGAEDDGDYCRLLVQYACGTKAGGGSR